MKYRSDADRSVAGADTDDGVAGTDGLDAHARADAVARMAIEYRSVRRCVMTTSCRGLQVARDRLDDDRRAVAQHLRYSAHHLRRIVSRTDHRVPAHLLGVRHHQGMRFGARAFAQLGEEGDVTALDGLERGADGSEDR